MPTYTFAATLTTRLSEVVRPMKSVEGTRPPRWRRRLGRCGQRVLQGSHRREEDLVLKAKSLKSGAPGRIRTHDPLVRRNGSWPYPLVMAFNAPIRSLESLLPILTKITAF